MKWSPQQDDALIAFKRWWEEGQPGGVFHLFGFAGSGKTTLALELANSINTQPVFAAFTGKAASVMRGKGCTGASTIHSLIYTTKTRSRLRLIELERELAEIIDPIKKTELQEEIKKERENLKQPNFSLNEASRIRQSGLVILDECFVAGTLVDTPKGQVPIEQLSSGDMIINACGKDKVLAIMKKEVNSLAQITCGNVAITCSENHRFFTQRGLVYASELRPGDTLLSTTEAMRLLWEACNTKVQGEPLSSVLLSQVQRDLVDAISGIQKENTQSKNLEEIRRGTQAFLEEWFFGSKGANRANSEIEASHRPNSCSEDISNYEGSRTQMEGAGRQRCSDDALYPELSALSFRGRLGTRIRCTNENETTLPTLLQDRSSQLGIDDCVGIGREFSQRSENEGKGCSERCVSEGIRVDCVEVFQQGDTRLDRYRDANGKLYLYDIQATQHSSFSIEGCLVHNCSMVDDRIGSDLMSFKVPILVLGDPAQLPPVKGGGFFMTKEPEVMLTDVHRTALDNPVLALATKVRQGEAIELGNYGDSQVITRSQLEQGCSLTYDQVIVGKNATRRSANDSIRLQLGFTEQLPVQHDKLVCLKNNHDLGLMNGTIHRVLKSEDTGYEVLLKVEAEDNGEVVDVCAYPQPFKGEETPRWSNEGLDEFDYGYAITCHKSQGSEWGNVFIVDESSVFRNERNRWLYTAITRASNKVMVVR